MAANGGGALGTASLGGQEADDTLKATLVLPLGILLAAGLIETGERVPDGAVVESVASAWSKLLELIKRDPEVIFRIPPRQLEELIAGAYREAGWDEVILTPRSGDLGRDVIAAKKGFNAVRIVEQVKAYKPGHLVTAEEVRALWGVVAADPRCTKGIVTTTSEFAPRLSEDGLLAPLMPYRVELKAGSQLLKWLHGTASKPA